MIQEGPTTSTPPSLARIIWIGNLLYLGVSGELFRAPRRDPDFLVVPGPSYPLRDSHF